MEDQGGLFTTWTRTLNPGFRTFLNLADKFRMLERDIYFHIPPHLTSLKWFVFVFHNCLFFNITTENLLFILIFTIKER